MRAKKSRSFIRSLGHREVSRWSSARPVTSYECQRTISDTRRYISLPKPSEEGLSSASLAAASRAAPALIFAIRDSVLGHPEVHRQPGKSCALPLPAPPPTSERRPISSEAYFDHLREESSLLSRFVRAGVLHKGLDSTHPGGPRVGIDPVDKRKAPKLVARGMVHPACFSRRVETDPSASRYPPIHTSAHISSSHAPRELACLYCFSM